jgi:hypothetical protein
LAPQAFCSRSLSFPERERITTESSVAIRQCPFSSMRERTDFWWWLHCCKVFFLQCHSYCTVCGPRSDCVHKTTPLGWPQNSCQWRWNIVGCYMQCISGMVFCESSNAGLILEETSFRSKRWFARFS